MKTSHRGGVAGYSLIEMMVTMAASVLLSLLLVDLFKFATSTLAAGVTYWNLETLRQQISRSVVDDNAWLKTVTQGSQGGASPSSAMDCLLNGSGCTLNTPHVFALYDNNNQIVFDSTNGNNGFMNTGQLCNSYGTAPCLYRYALQWSALCAGACTTFQIMVTASLRYAGQPMVPPLNQAQYKLSLYRGDFSGMPTGGVSMLAIGPGALLNLTGTPTVNSPSSTVAVNGNISASGTSTVTANQILATGSASTAGSAVLIAAPQTGASLTGDPLTALPAPSTVGLSTYAPIPIVSMTGVVLTPGVYTNPISITDSTVTLSPGVYVLNGGISTAGTSVLIANGVFLYIAGGAMSLLGTLSGQLTPPTSGTYTGVVAFQARANSSPATMSGGINWSTQGTLYFPAAPLSIAGSETISGAKVFASNINISGGTINLSP